ncbi:hypothetical protein GPZ77_34485 (plasmid) [Streptomyces sp. QHH-9511]|uniref:hypothetical protein n=1 Tax=Streptomyces sp. QHH-9511 TaxID=2684468 RepID=UPI001315DFDC|nr:hypothetical protein [Streptomyces sp. QHH-9511]QGZ53340.1 hypothetical protein GPZ77_34485 [Streptomyces sp. QHH-9511]
MSQDRTKFPLLHPRPDAFAEALRRSRVADLSVVRPARRTLAEMAPGYQRQPLLRLVPLKAADDACAICGSWKCTGNCWSAAPAPTSETAVAA